MTRRPNLYAAAVIAFAFVVSATIAVRGEGIPLPRRPLLTSELALSCRDRATVEEKATCMCAGSRFLGKNVPPGQDPNGPPSAKEIASCIDSLVQRSQVHPECWMYAGTELIDGCECRRKTVAAGACPSEGDLEACAAFRDCLAIQTANATRVMEALLLLKAKAERDAAAAASAGKPEPEPVTCGERDCGLYGPKYCQICCPANTHHVTTHCDSFLGWGKAHCECAVGAAQGAVNPSPQTIKCLTNGTACNNSPPNASNGNCCSGVCGTTPGYSTPQCQP